MDALEVFQKLGRGHLMDEVYAAILDVAEEVVVTGNPGTVTLTLKLSHPQDSDTLLFVVRETIKRAMPQGSPKGAMFFALDGELHTKDPRQQEFELRAVEGGRNELRTPPESGQIREAE